MNLLALLSRYSHWLHTQWPAGTVEKLPDCDAEGRTSVPGVRIIGDLTGVPLLKFASASGVNAIRSLLKEPDFQKPRDPAVRDVVILGGGVSGIAAALEAKAAGLDSVVLEVNEAFSTITNFPAAKPIHAYPEGFQPGGGLQMRATVKEGLLAELDSARHDTALLLLDPSQSQLAAAVPPQVQLLSPPPLLQSLCHQTPNGRTLLAFAGQIQDFSHLMV